MAFRRAVLIALCAVVVACGSDGPTTPAPVPPSPAPPQTFKLSGRVFAAGNGTPVAGANVFLRQGSSQSQTQTDAQGAYSFAGLQAGTFTIQVALEDYEFIQQEISLTSDTTLDFAFTRRVYMLSGRVTDIANGASISDATITILDGKNANRSTTTDTTGAFQLADVIFGGFTVRFRHNGYDSEFRAVRLVGDTALDVQMRPAMQSLSGTWAGGIAYSSSGSGVPVAEATLTQSGSSLEGVLASSGGRFTGTLRNPTSIGTTTEITGTMTLFFSGGGGRNIISCQGTGSFTGTVNWTRLVITAPQVTFPCAPPYTSVTMALTRQQ